MFGKQDFFVKEKRLEVKLIEVKVMLWFLLFNKIDFQKEIDEVSPSMEYELLKWSTSKGFKFSVQEVEKPRYIVGHYVHQLNVSKHCKVISFSK